MDKAEYQSRLEELNSLVKKEDYEGALAVVEAVDWQRVKSLRTLGMVADVYEANKRYPEAKKILLMAYDRSSIGKGILYRLVEVSVKMKDFDEAIDFYNEFEAVARHDNSRYLLKYKILRGQKAPLEEQISLLEEYKEREFTERWAYELANLYSKAGETQKCIDACDELILWFSEGKYVTKAMELKMLHQPLTPEQQEKYDHRFDAPGSHIPSQNSVQDNEYSGNESYEQGYAKGGSYDQEQGYAQDGSYDQGQGYAQDGSYDQSQGYAQDGSYDQDQSYAQDSSYDQNQSYVQDSGYDQVNGDTQIYDPVQPAQQETPTQPVQDDYDIHVKTMDVGQYNTINLQAELAAGLREVLGEEPKGDTAKATSDSITRSIVAPMMDSDTESLDYPEIAEVSEDDLEPETEQIEGSEVFFGETGEIGDLSQVPEVETEEILPEEPASLKKQDVVPELSEAEVEPEATTPVEPPKELANVLAQESDGQISLVMPEAESIEKQITGQINIEDILAEWERKKKENLEKREEEVRQHVLQQTGAMFTEFEQAVRDGLLEKLEKEKAVDADTVTDTDEVEELEEIADVNDETEKAPAEVSEEEPEPADTDIVDTEEVEELEEEPAVAEYEEESATEEPDAVVDMEVTQEPAAEILEVPEETTAEIEEASEETTAETEEASEESVAEAEEEPEEAVEEVHEDEQPQTPEPPVVERDKAKVRALTREERELYAPFIQSKSAREQLVKAIDNISLAAYTGNVIITGEEGMDTLSLAKNMIREIQATDSNFSGKVAKISGHALNKKDAAETLNRLQNGALIICKASEMNNKTVDTMYKALQQENQGIVIILEDTRKEIDRFLEKYEKLQESFTSRMDVEALSNDTLVAFGRQYAREREYSIDELGVLALHTRIEDMQTIDHVVTVVDVKEIVDGAIAHANKKTLKHFFDVLFAKRYDDEDMIILTEKDFV